MVFLYTIIIFISNYDLSSSENYTLSFNNTIDNIITSKIPGNASNLNDTTVINYLYGDQDIDDSTQFLDIFKPDETKRLFEVAQTKGELIERELNKSRRWYTTPGFLKNDYFKTKFMDFMKQSVYATRYRLKDTKYLRRAYANDVAYNIAILYGSLMHMRTKMDNLYSTLYFFDTYVKFLWFIVLYERCIALTVDANFMVERIFALQLQNKKEIGIDVDYMKMDPPNPNKGTFQEKMPNP